MTRVRIVGWVRGNAVGFRAFGRFWGAKLVVQCPSCDTSWKLTAPDHDRIEVCPGCGTALLLGGFEG